jgi:hypothetical protein
MEGCLFFANAWMQESKNGGTLVYPPTSRERREEINAFLAKPGLSAVT